MYEGIADCLEKMSSNRGQYDAKSVTEANGLLMNMCSSKWIVGIQVYLRFSGYLKTLSQLLQGPAKDVMIAYEKVTVVIDELESIRKNCDETFFEVWNEAQMMAEQTCSELKRPRPCSRQTTRSNVDAESTEEFYKRSVFIPYLDHLISEMKSRFTTTSRLVSRSLGLIPAYLEQLEQTQVLEMEEYFGDDLPSRDSFKEETRLWKREWSHVPEGEKVPSDLKSTLICINSSFYPNISMILRLLLLMPVSAASVERSHSALKDLKTKKRSTMCENRLNALMLLYIHRDISLDYSKIIDMFSAAHPRRMKLSHPLSQLE